MSRDDQFAGFASRLLQELLDQCAYVAISEWATGGDSFKSEKLIARRAYDLVRHVAAEITDETKDYLVMIEKIPDMRQWPEETSRHSEDKKCCICGSVASVEETLLSDAQNKHRHVPCCERCFMSGRIFEIDDLDTDGDYRPTARKLADMPEETGK